jgi:hypothetical protein
MKPKRLIEVLLGASLVVGAAGCTCPDPHVEDEASVTRAMYAAQIESCLASDLACDQLCRAVFELEPGVSIEKCVIRALDSKSAIVEATYLVPMECIGGRRPDGFVEPRCGSRAAGAWLARMATLEAASITAFARLARALEKHDAPPRLVAMARAAIIDEVIHARLTAQLARRFGGTVEAPVIAAVSEPTLAELARENALEGQVAETFGALLATCQAQLATDPEIRGVFARISVDEARHAALAHELAQWFAGVVDAETLAAIAVEQRHAATNVCGQLDAVLSEDDRALLGIPDVTRLRTATAQTFAMLAA